MSNSTGLSTVSALVKQTALLNSQQYTSAKQGLEFAQTAIKTTKLTYTSQQNKLETSLRNGILSKDNYDKQIDQLKRQYELDCAPWEMYVKKLRQLIEEYSSKSETKQNKKRIHEQSSSNQKSQSSTMPKRTRISFSSSSSSSSSSDSDTVALHIPPTTSKPSNPIIVKHDSSTNTDPLEFSLRSPFPSTPNIISYTAQTTHITQRIPLQQINEIAAKQIVLLHDEGQLVRWNDVLWRILTYYHVHDLGNLGIQRADQIPCIDNLIRTQNKINIYLDGYNYWQTIGTLNELEHDLAHIFHKNDYHELLIGPIEKQPKIIELFRLRSLRNEKLLKNLQTSDILKYLDQYMTKEYVWKNENDINLDDFYKYLMEQNHVKNVYQLGIRIKQVYLARHCIKSMQANQRKTMEIARSELSNLLTELAQKQVENVLKTMNSDEQRKKYATMEPIDIINEMVENCRELCQSYSSFRKVSHALQIILKDPMLRNIFQIAICQGDLKVPEKIIKPKELDKKTNKKVYFHSSDSDDDDDEIPAKKDDKASESRKIQPNENDLFQAFKQQIGSVKCLTFDLLSRIEQRLCEKYHINHFDELGYGIFMNYIQQNEQRLFSSEMKFNLISTESRDNHSNLFVPFEDLEQFILHTLNQSTDQQYIQQLICYHFQIQSFEQLGYGSYSLVLNQIQQKQTSKNTSVHYECIISDHISQFQSKSTSSIKDLEKQALILINQCSLLDNIDYYTQWNLSFLSQLGKLKPFLIQHKIPILEINQFTYLKLSSNSTIEQFKESLYNYDPILTSGHLVSILIQYEPLHYAPISLLSNIVQTFFLTIKLDDHLYDFLIHLFIRIPFLILSSIIQRIFLEPLIKLEGSQIKIRELFWKYMNKQDSNISTRFIQLGEQLGFTEWSIENIKSQPVIKTQPEKPLTVPTSIIHPPISVSKVEIKSSNTNPFDLIERIRRDKFGIGLNLSNESQYLTEQLKSLIGRSLERLSKELYNTDMHFVLELIQNADDNQYNNDKPTLIFVIDHNTINIYNNEIGFNENNIQALCDIGKSTKGKHKQGYIGQKGIGFKSVFTVCNRPEIYSNGYQICFDAQNGSIGYILPNWIEYEQRDIEYSNYPTRICLPLKSENEMEKHKSRSITESFNDIHPSLLLFLNRLRSIRIDNRLTNSKQIYHRIDIPGTSIVEIHCGDIKERWFVIKKQLLIPDEVKMSLDDVIEATEIALAFPLHEIKNNGNIKLTKQDVYAYLPLRTFGFTFIIQADFEVPSSRQDILSDSLWNQFLLNEIPSLFLSSLDAFYRERSHLPIDPLRLFLYFLPNETSIYSNNLFTPVCRRILQSLRSHKFLPVLNNHHFHLPNECIIINDLTIEEILTPEILYNHLHLYYLTDDLYDHEKQLYDLGVHRFNHNQLIEIIKNIFTNEITFENRKILSKWFSCLYRYLNQLSIADEEQVLKHLQSLKIFPLKNHPELISLNHLDQTIFFPSKNLPLPSIIENDLLIIDDHLWLNIQENSLQIFTLLERLGIQHLTSKTVCEQHIFPIFENEQMWKLKSTEVLIAYVKFIFDLWTKQKHSIDLPRFKSIVQLLTNDGFKQPIHDSIHFSPNFGNPYDLSKDFYAYNWLLLSDEYLRDVIDRKKLHQFFSELGVSNFLLPITNFSYEQFNSLINIQSISMNKKLFRALEETWANDDNDLFLKHLTEMQWIPTIQTFYSYNLQSNQIESKEISRLDKSNKIYLKTKQIQQLFAEHVQYIDVEINTDSSFVNDIGLVQHITLNDVISMLLVWSECSVFYTSIAHIQNVYEYISKHMNINNLRELIMDKSIFFVPISPLLSVDKMKIIQGRFVSMSEICWIDPTNLFMKYSVNTRTILERYYSEQKAIFLDIFSIPMNPTIDEYIHLLVHITSLEITKETIQDVYLIFKTLGKCFEQSSNLLDKQDLQNKLSNKSIFPTKDSRWVSLNDNPLIADNDHIAQLFIQLKNIPLIDLPSSDILIFYNLCDIKFLSSSITIEPIITNPTNGTSIENLLSPLVPYIQLFMKSRSEFQDAYQWTKSIHMSTILRNLQFIIVDSIQLIYRYKFDLSICLFEEVKSYYDNNQRSFYIDQQSVEQSKHYTDIFHSFAKIFIPNDNNNLTGLLANFISLLYNEDENNLEIFAKYQQFNLEFNDSDDIPWQLSSVVKPIKRFEAKIDEKKVQTLLENVAQNQEQYNTNRQKKREQFKNQLSIDRPSDPLVRFDHIRPDKLSSIVETTYEIIEQPTKNFNIEDLTDQVLANRDSAIGSDQKSLEKIGRWGEQWVNEYLHKKYHEELQSNKIEIIWLNENFEQGKPYDFIFKNLQTNLINYIEVKSTISNHRQLIPITYNELQYCCSLSDKNQHFQIYRIYNTGQLNKVKLSIVDSLEEKLRKHHLELFLLI